MTRSSRSRARSRRCSSPSWRRGSSVSGPTSRSPAWLADTAGGSGVVRRSSRPRAWSRKRRRPHRCREPFLRPALLGGEAGARSGSGVHCDGRIATPPHRLRERAKQDLGRSQVRRKRHAVDVAHLQQCLDVGLVWVRGEWVAQERPRRRHLQPLCVRRSRVAVLGAAVHALHVEAERIGDLPARVSGRDQSEVR